MELFRESENFRIDLVDCNESHEGEYNPDDPKSVALWRVDIFCPKDSDEVIRNGSFCTNIPINTDIDELKVFLKTMLNHAEDLLKEYGFDNLGTVSRILGLYSWYDGNSNMKERAK